MYLEAGELAGESVRFVQEEDLCEPGVPEPIQELRADGGMICLRIAIEDGLIEDGLIDTLN
jgi:hypothetical protein